MQWASKEVCYSFDIDIKINVTSKETPEYEKCNYVRDSPNR